MTIKVFQLITVIFMGVQLGVSCAHFMQMPGKLSLPLDCYILGQNQVISYRVKLAFIEFSALICTALAAILLRRHKKVLGLTLVGLGCMLLMWLIWAFFIQPINQQIDGWTPINAPKNWSDLRYQWHIYHLFRLGIAALGMLALTASLLVSKAKPTTNSEQRDLA